VTLAGGILGNGGGQQLSNAVLYDNMKQKFGPEHDAVAGSPELPDAGERGQRATDVGGERRPPDQPRASGRVGRL
jgi:hypothetical protein